MKLRCIIVDDEPLALDILEEYIRRTPLLTLAGRYTSSVDALAALRGGGIDLALLDIQMPGLGGIDLARSVIEAGGGARVVFTTAFPDYALEGFRVDALDYLLKPVSFEEFTQAVARATAWFSRGHSQPEDRTQTLMVKSEYKQIVIPLGSIVRIEGTRDYIRIHTLDASGRPSSVQTLMNMGTVERMLPPDRFARIHRSHIVALDRVCRLERGRVVLTVPSPEGTPSPPLTLPLSETYKEPFTRALSAHALPSHPLQGMRSS